jgi:hemerythrin superfamily protein
VEQRIEIEIDPDGKIFAKTEGLKGEACIEEVQKLLEDIAILNEIKKTDEYYQKVDIKTQNIQKNTLG